MAYVYTDTDIFLFFHFERYQQPEKTPITLLDPIPSEHFNPVKTDTFDIFDRTTSSSSSSLLAASSVDMSSLLYNTFSLCLQCSEDISKGQFEWIKCHIFLSEEVFILLLLFIIYHTSPSTSYYCLFYFICIESIYEKDMSNPWSN